MVRLLRKEKESIKKNIQELNTQKEVLSDKVIALKKYESESKTSVTKN